MTASPPKPRKRTDKQRLPWLLIASVFLLVVVVFGIISIMIAPKQAGTSLGVDGAQQPCASPAGAPLPHDGPTNWDVITVGEGLLVPVSQTYGPAVTSGVPHCFSDDDGGALFAGINFLTWMMSKQNMLNVVETFAYPDDSKGEWIDEIIHKCGTNLAGCPFEQAVYPVGYHIDRVNQERVNVLGIYDMNPGSPGFVAVQVALRWNGNDWAVLMPAGSFPMDLVEVGYFTPWRPV